MPRVDIHIVTYNSADCIDACLESVLAQHYTDYQVTVFDNGSQDDSARRLAVWATCGVRVILNGSNLYYSVAHNRAIRESTSKFVLALNPDVILDPHFLARAVAAIERMPHVGSINGRLIRIKPSEMSMETLRSPQRDNMVLDGAGLMMRRSRRPDLRGNNLPANSTCTEPTYIFGADAACALYRRAMLDDIVVDGEYFDEDFMIYREDVDLAWRAQLLGWDCLYLPDAIAYHVRSFRPGQRRHAIASDLKRHSVKNGWLLVIKNDYPGAILKNILWVLPYQVKILAGLLFTEPSSLSAIPQTIRLLPRILRKRAVIQKIRARSAKELRRWFA